MLNNICDNTKNIDEVVLQENNLVFTSDGLI